MYYPAQLDYADDGITVSFRDIPEALTCGDTKDEALQQAADALATAMEFYFEDKRPVPAPSAAQVNDELVALPASLAAKVLLLNEVLAQHVSNAELARRLGMTKQTAQRLFDLSHATKIDTLQDALKALGKDLTISIR